MVTDPGFSLRYIKYAFTEPVLAKSFQKNSDVRKGGTPLFLHETVVDCNTAIGGRQDLTTP